MDNQQILNEIRITLPVKAGSVFKRDLQTALGISTPQRLRRELQAFCEYNSIASQLYVGKCDKGEYSVPLQLAKMLTLHLFEDCKIILVNYESPPRKRKRSC